MNEEPLALHDVFNFMNDRNVIMSFQADFTHSVITSILNSLKKILEDSKMNFQNQKRFYNVVAECLDNISKHNVDTELLRQLKSTSTLFMISEQENSFTIQTGNYVLNSEMDELKGRLEKVNALDREGLKKLYREEIQNRPEGGGLGIIDVSMRSGCKIDYKFTNVTENISFFVLQTQVSK